jgi:hypothetical protein
MRRRFVLLLAAALLTVIPAVPARATPLAPFIDLQEAGLTVTDDGVGLVGWGGGPRELNVTVKGTVRFALLYWSGWRRGCPLSGSVCTFSQPYRDQQMVFAGTPITGTVIGTETQPTSSDGRPILNISYFADVTSLVSAAGLGTHSFTIADGNTASNLSRLDGAGLFVAYTNAADPTFYRVLVWDNGDFLWKGDPTPGSTRSASPVTFGHGSSAVDRTGDFWFFVGGGDAKHDRIDIGASALYDALGGTDGRMYDTDRFRSVIPGGTSTTTVLIRSVGTDSDDLFWTLAAMRVRL